MPAVPLGIKSNKREAGFLPETRLVNMLLEKDGDGVSPDGFMRVQRPGLADRQQFGGEVRGLFQADNIHSGSWFVVEGNVLRYLDTPLTALGAIDGADRVAFVGRRGDADDLFILGANTLYLWRNNTLTVVDIPDGYVPVDIEGINSYLVIACSSGRFYWMEPGQIVVDALNFATAESSPDGLISCRRLVDEIFFGGTQSIEPWQPTGDADAPFQKAGGRQYERGVLARDTMRRFDNALVWVGDDRIVYRVAAVPTRMSDHALEERLRQSASEYDLPSAFALPSDGHKLYVLHIPGQGDWAFDAATEQWSEFCSTEGSGWPPRVAASSTAETLVGDDNGRVNRVDQTTFTDAGSPFPRIVSGTVSLMAKGPRNDSLAIGCGASGDATLKVRWRDGKEDFPAFYEELPMEEGPQVIDLWRLGSLEKPFRTFELRVDDPVQISVYGAMANEAWQ